MIQRSIKVYNSIPINECKGKADHLAADCIVYYTNLVTEQVLPTSCRAAAADIQGKK